VSPLFCVIDVREANIFVNDDFRERIAFISFFIRNTHAGVKQSNIFEKCILIHICQN